MEKLVPELTIRSARKEDLPALAEIFEEGFNRELIAVLGRTPRRKLGEDLFSFLIDIPGEEAIVATVADKVVGYIIVSHNTSQLFRKFFTGGYWLKWKFAWLRGEYGFRWVPLVRVLRDKLIFLRSKEKGIESESRVLCIAVKKEFQGRGVGASLIREGMEILKNKGAAAVRLEVRTDNLPARRLYQKSGFREVGKMKISGGELMIMERTIR
ncbi:[ribosomal protein S18]-alanine N-acetyltransferase [Candidatus Hakubella thermalkaliphila]|uniref:[ribosomal protein S18]-alanine N-acetyltransferase n=2 Tax=Candidatus Hakubella thermalkaliphila TaxID=2754717 RepID=A0A6V8P9P6_9ACTN|nr:GNAT family N-acetyltransferase [Candidatus Hakubella thermalkaliphila]GFP18647.1 [ribosomal protein S18]-alanine N-acetyltransferase [Candidatus Hakubella thermalkaliphila]GFP29405.1 [ribosomal protein S18]-alanine N-acetyltransferase [Candidatus Hakubella thermalkaliphila]